MSRTTLLAGEQVDRAERNLRLTEAARARIDG
jgi:hypothetical protein